MDMKSILSIFDMNRQEFFTNDPNYWTYQKLTQKNIKNYQLDPEKPRQKLFFFFGTQKNCRWIAAASNVPWRIPRPPAFCQWGSASNEGSWAKWSRPSCSSCPRTGGFCILFSLWTWCIFFEGFILFSRNKDTIPTSRHGMLIYLWFFDQVFLRCIDF